MVNVRIIKVLTRTALFAMLATLCLPLSAESLADYDVKDLLEGDKKTSRFSHRFGYTGSLYRDSTLSELRLTEGQQDLDSLSVVSDWHPRGGLFRLSAGLIYQEDSELSNYGSKQYQIPLQFNRPEMSLRGNQSDGISPYLGLGWGSKLLDSGRMGLNLDLGVLYQPEDTLLNDDGLSLGSEGQNWDDAIMQGLDELDLEPVFSLGVSYNF